MTLWRLLRNRVCRTVVLAFAGLLAAQAVKADSVLHLGPDRERATLGGHLFYLEDPEGKLGIDDVLRANTAGQFKPYARKHPNFGFSSSTWWLRFTLDRDETDRRPWMLSVAYPPLDRLEFFSLRPGGQGYDLQIGGDHLPFHEREIHDPGYHFRLPATTGEQTFYLRVQSESAVTLPMELRPAQVLDEDRAHDNLALGLFFGTLLALALYNLLLTITIRDVSYLYYVVYVVVTGMALFSYNGLAYEFLWPDAVYWNNRAPVVLPLAALCAAALFTRRFLLVPQMAPKLDAALIALATTLGMFAVLALGAISYAASAHVFSVLAIGVALALICTGVYSMSRGYRPARYFLIAWAVLIVALIAHSMRVFGVLPSNLFTVYGIQLGTGLEMILLSLALADRINEMKREKEQAQAVSLAAAQRSEHELEALVEQRVEELATLNLSLKNEIGARRKAQEALLRMAHHDSLTGLPNRNLFRDRFAMAAAAARRSGERFALVMIDLDGFKKINDTLGHESGDMLLKGVADALRSCVRETDTIARFGGDEFVLLLGGLIDPAEAALIADKIIQQLSVPIPLGTQSRPAAPSLGICLYPDDGTEMEALLKCADQAMYRAKEAGGSHYVFYSDPLSRKKQAEI